MCADQPSLQPLDMNISSTKTQRLEPGLMWQMNVFGDVDRMISLMSGLLTIFLRYRYNSLICWFC